MKYTLKSFQVRRVRTLQALNWASKFHVSRSKVGLLRLKCSGVERQLTNSGKKRPNEPSSSVQWFRELTRAGSATPSFIDAGACGPPCTEEGSTAWYLRITLISEVNWTCRADEYLYIQY
jgi:hypothetical protein